MGMRAVVILVDCQEVALHVNGRESLYGGLTSHNPMHSLVAVGCIGRGCKDLV